MTLKIFVSSDNEKGLELPPSHYSECRCIWKILEYLKLRLDNSLDYYLAAINLHNQASSADMVLFSKFGIGVIEAKSTQEKSKLVIDPGKNPIYENEKWRAVHEDKEDYIFLGGNNANNPGHQVTKYMKHIKKILQNSTDNFIPFFLKHPNDFHIQTAVVICGPIDISVAQENVRHSHFAILKPDEVPNWATTLRFESYDEYPPFSSNELTIKQAMKIAREKFDTIESHEIPEILRKAGPYGKLEVIKYDVNKEEYVVIHDYDLDQPEMTIGRGANNSIIIDEDYNHVSRDHALVERDLNNSKITIQDFSKHGTYINKTRLSRGESYELGFGWKISLGLPGDSKGCLLRLERPNDLSKKPGKTG